jgi:hypothetical protein
LIGRIHLEHRQLKDRRRVAENSGFIFIQISGKIAGGDQYFPKVLVNGAVIINHQNPAVTKRIDVHK